MKPTVIFVFVALLVICGADWRCIISSCPQPWSVVNASIAEISGIKHYVKFYSGYRKTNLDGVAFQIIKHDSQKYMIKRSIINKKNKRKFKFFVINDHPSQNINELYYMSSTWKTIFYAIPFLEKNSSAVLYRCLSRGYRGIRPQVLVLTTSLDNNLTKALEVARNITPPEQKLIELPFSYKHFFPSKIKEILY